MKVGTDGTLLGAWAQGGSSILDIGTGTGLIALMMAQRFPVADVLGIDIDASAVTEALDNVAQSLFANRVRIIQADFRSFREGPFAALVCNPPFFEQSMTCPNPQRTCARHTTLLTYRDLMETAWNVLADDGELSVVIPFDCRQRLEQEAFLAGFFKSRECGVKTTPRKPIRRYLLAFRKHPCQTEVTEGILEISPGVRSPWYCELTNDFYL
jgi:tRNA1Val (adenine37-N6)-methyltransferase